MCKLINYEKYLNMINDNINKKSYNNTIDVLKKKYKKYHSSINRNKNYEVIFRTKGIEYWIDHTKDDYFLIRKWRKAGNISNY